MNANALTQRLSTLAAAIAEAHATVEDGNGVDLSGLEAAVRSVCDDIIASPPTEGREELEHAIGAMLGELDRLAQILDQQHQQLATGEGLSQAAQSAYATNNRDDGGESN
jgi:hypothetical protein